MKEFSKKYLSILKNELKGINLTRILDEDEFYHKQILDSTLPLENSSFILDELRKRRVLVDVGFGGGFPLIPLSFKFPQFKFLGFESKNKKVKAVQKISELLSLKNVKVYHQRIEDVLIDVDVILTFKAVGEVSKILKNLRASKSILVCFYKGPNFLDKEGKEGLPSGWELVENKEVDIPGTEGRTFLIYKNTVVPCGTNPKNKIKLVKLSQFL